MYNLREEELSYHLEQLRATLKENEKGEIVLSDSNGYNFVQVKDILGNAERSVDFLRFREGMISETEYLNMWPIEHEYDPLEGYDYLDEDDE